MTAVAKLPEKWRAEADMYEAEHNNQHGYVIDWEWHGKAIALERAADELEAALSPAELGGVEAVPLVQSSAPERIWLAVADDAYYADQPFPNGLEEVCWSSDAPLEVCVPYVRADLSTPRAAEAVTDEMVGRALSSYYRNWSTWKQAVELGGDLSGAMRAALTAALKGE